MGPTPTMPPMGADSGGFPPPTPQVTFIIKPRPKWQALRTIAAVFKVFAWMSGGLGGIAALATLAGGSQFGTGGATAGVFLGIAELLGVGVGFLGLYGYAELILLLISIEENTRKL